MSLVSEILDRGVDFFTPGCKIEILHNFKKNELRGDFTPGCMFSEANLHRGVNFRKIFNTRVYNSGGVLHPGVRFPGQFYTPVYHFRRNLDPGANFPRSFLPRQNPIRKSTPGYFSPKNFLSEELYVGKFKKYNFKLTKLGSNIFEPSKTPLFNQNL